MLVGSGEASVISQSGGTSRKCGRYQACCAYYTLAKDAKTYIPSIAVTVTGNAGPITSLQTTIQNPNYDYENKDPVYCRLTNVGSLEDMHLSCRDSRALYIVYAENIIDRNIISFDNDKKFNTFKGKTYKGQGGILAGIHVDNLNECANACEQNSKCTGVTFDVTRQENCSLSQGLSPITDGNNNQYALFKL